LLICVSTCLSIHLPIYPSAYPFVSPSACLFIQLSVPLALC
jgi:hypothetical protein